MDDRTLENLVRKAAISSYIGRDQRSELEQAAKWLVDSILAESGANADMRERERLGKLQDEIRTILRRS